MTANTICLASIPAELRALPQWVCWKAEEVGGRMTKVPYCVNGIKADTSNSATWATLQDVVNAQDGRFSGIGFVFYGSYTGVDLDHHRDAVTGELDAFAHGIVTRLGSYSEASQSGKGVHVIVGGEVPSGRRDAKLGLEIYSSRRFFVMTGNHIPGTPDAINPNQPQIDALFQEYFSKPEPSKQPVTPRSNHSLPLSDRKLVEKASAATNGKKFALLWAGDWEGAGFPSQSEADASLLSSLRFWTGGDRGRAFSMFAQSGLNREKWHREDYREDTWAAIDHGEVYDPTSSRIRKAEHSATVCKTGSVAGEYLGESDETGAGTPEQVFDRLAMLSPVDYDRCRVAEAEKLAVRTSTLDTEVAKRRPPEQAPGNPELQPWPETVDGGELLDDIAATYNRFCYLPPSADAVLSVFVLFTYCYRTFDFAAIIAAWSPEPECGKGRVLDVTEKLAKNAFRTANTSPAVLYHQVSKGDVTVLIDEFDSQLPDKREAIGNILKSGFQSNGKAHRMTERNGEQVVVEFSTYAPKMIATIGLDTLDKASRTRSIGIRMSRKSREVKLDKFRRYDGTDICRRCIRWAHDNDEALKSIGPLALDECGTDRQEDVWEPLVAVARIAGGDWERRIRGAAIVLSGQSTAAASESAGHQVLVAIHEHFTSTGLTRLTTKELTEHLDEQVDLSAVSRGRGLSPSLLARLLRPYGVESRNLKTQAGKVNKGYYLEDFTEAFSVYLVPPLAGTPVLKRYSATEAVNIEPNPPFADATKVNGSVSENLVPTNVYGGGSGVAAENHEYAKEGLADEL